MPGRRSRPLRTQAGREQEYLRATHYLSFYLIDVQRVINQILLPFLVNGHIPYRRGEQAEVGRPA